jgi:hypothetical protein
MIIFIMLNLTNGNSQARMLQLGISNQGTSLPLLGYPGLLYKSFHPGLWVNYGIKINQKVKNQWYVTASSSVYYHRFVQSLFTLGSQLHYRLQFSDRISFQAFAGAGYGAQFWNTARFEFKDGEYRKISSIVPRSQWIAQLGFGIGYKLKNTSNNGTILLSFQSMFSGPFVKKYVSVLPVNSLLLGYSFNIRKDVQ